MDVSVIIPVYNLENYIKKNIESMMCQEGVEAEFIYINDGSTDKSGDILAEYAHKDSRIKIINQENKGLSEARNSGILIAKGEWIVFVDGDDSIMKNSLKTLYNIQKKSQLDVLLAREYLRDIDSTKLYSHENNCIKTKIASGKCFLYNNQLSFTGCFYSFKRQFLLDNKLFFMPNVLHEDMEFIPKSLYCAKKMGKTTFSFYQRTTRSGSITTTKQIKRSHDLFLIAQKLQNFIQKNNISNKWWNTYIAELYSQGIHVGISNGFPIRNILTSESERKKACFFLNNGSKKHKILFFFLKAHLDSLYKLLYKFYNKAEKMSALFFSA